MDRTGIRWDEDEITLCLGLYYLYSSGSVSFEDGVKALGKMLGRTRGSVGFKLGNIASCDNPGRGFPNISKLDLAVFRKYSGNIDSLFLDIREILSRRGYGNADASILLKGNPYSGSYDYNQDYLNETTDADYSAESRETIVRVREKQWAFRTALLTNYDRTCCISGIAMPQLLVASHIVPWAADKSKRLDPSNGLLLNSILDRAFDQGLITFGLEKHDLIVSDRIRDEKTLDYLSSFRGRILALPKHSNAIPAKENLQYHNDVIFNSFLSDNNDFQCILHPDNQ